jgi:hypothetical protein
MDLRLRHSWLYKALTEVTTLDPVIVQANAWLKRKTRTYMKFLITRWNLEPLYPNPSASPSTFLPVARARKFSAVFGTVCLGGEMISWQPMHTYPSIETQDDYVINQLE